MTKNNEIQKIGEDWSNSFPDLSIYKKNKIYKIVGPIVVGIELINLPNLNAYRPYFVVYSLWGGRTGSDLRTCMSGPNMLIEIKNNNKLQFNIKYSEHDKFFQEAVLCFKKQILMAFNANVYLDILFSIVNFQTDFFPFRNHSGAKASLYDLKFKLSLYVEGNFRMLSILEEIKLEQKQWNMSQFEFTFGNFDSWFQNLRKEADNPEYFFSLVKANRDLLLSKGIKFSELIQ